MNRLMLIPVFALALAVGMIATPLQASGVETVASFDAGAGELSEGLAVDKRGNTYVGMALLGEIRKLPARGDPEEDWEVFADGLGPGDGFLVGLAVDAPGNVYAAVASFQEDTHGVWRVATDGSAERIAPLETSTLPNVPAFDKRGNLFVSDSFGGAIYRIDRHGELSEWVQDSMLVGDLELDLPVGANGIAFGRDGDLYVANSNFGRIVRIPVNPDGSADKEGIEVLVDDPALKGADGIAFDNRGDLYVAVNEQNTVVRVRPDGTVDDPLADIDDGMDFPASVAFGTGRSDRTSLFVTNFAFLGAGDGPSLVKIDTGVPGKPLP